MFSLSSPHLGGATTCHMGQVVAKLSQSARVVAFRFSTQQRVDWQIRSLTRFRVFYQASHSLTILAIDIRPLWSNDAVSFKAAAWAIHQKPKTAHEKLVLVILSDCHNGDSGQCNPSLSYLAEHALCSKTTIKSALNSLEEQGFLKRQRGNYKTRTQYKLCLDKQATRRPRSGDGLGQQKSKVGKDTTHLGQEVTDPRSSGDPEPVIEPVKNQEGTSKANEIYDFWIYTMGKTPTKTKFTDDRKRKVKARLKKYSVDDIKQAIVNCRNSPFHNGTDKNNSKVYDDLELICRNDTKLEQFRDMEIKKPETKTDRNIKTMQNTRLS